MQQLVITHFIVIIVIMANVECDESLCISQGSFQRQVGSIATMSGADDAVYNEYKKLCRKTQSTSSSQHPLFKKFRKL